MAPKSLSPAGVTDDEQSSKATTARKTSKGKRPVDDDDGEEVALEKGAKRQVCGEDGVEKSA